MRKEGQPAAPLALDMARARGVSAHARAWICGTKAEDVWAMPRPTFKVSLRQTLLDPRNRLNAEKIARMFTLSAVGPLRGSNFRRLWMHARD